MDLTFIATDMLRVMLTNYPSCASAYARWLAITMWRHS